MIEYLLISFAICFALQILYLLLYTIAIAGYRQTDVGSDAPMSVIICVRNELEKLQNNLPKILCQKHNQFEVIVVNDRSTDGSYEYLIGLKDQYPNFKLVQVDSVPDHIHSKKYAITLGVKAAQYENLVFTDADCHPVTENWITKMANKKAFVLGVSLYEKQRGLLNLLIRYETYITAMQYIGNGLMGKPYMGVGRNLGYSKQLFIEKKGFNQFQGVVGGDDDLFVNQHATRKNTKITLGNDALIYSSPKTTWSSFFIQKTRHLSVGKYYKFVDKVILGIFSLSLVMFWISGITFAFFEPKLVLVGFSIRLVIMYLLFYTMSKRFGERFVPFVIPILDFLYVICYISAGTVAVFSKKIRWN